MKRAYRVAVVVGVLLILGCWIHISNAAGGEDVLIEGFEYRSIEQFEDVWWVAASSNGANYRAELISGDESEGNALKFIFNTDPANNTGSGNDNVIWRRKIELEESRAFQFDIKLEKGTADYIAIFFHDSDGKVYQNNYSKRVKVNSLGDEWETITLDFTAESMIGWSGAEFEDVTWPLKQMSFNFLWPKGGGFEVVVDNIRTSSQINLLQDYYVRCGDIELRISPATAWNLWGVNWRDYAIGVPAGWYGTVITETGSDWVGSGHTEGGKEEIRRVWETVDGVVDDLPGNGLETNRQVDKSYVLEKESVLRGIFQKSRVEITAEGIVEHVMLEAQCEQPINRLYVFMHCWTPKTTAYKGKLLDGDTVSGTLESNESFKIQDDVYWVAQIDEESNIGCVMFFEEGTLGKWPKSFIWDRSCYHKFYLTAGANEVWPAGTTYEAKVAVTFFDEKAGISLDDAIEKAKKLLLVYSSQSSKR